VILKYIESSGLKTHSRHNLIVKATVRLPLKLNQLNTENMKLTLLVDDIKMGHKL